MSTKQKEYRITLRIDKSLKNKIKKIATNQKRSLNSEISKAIIAHCSAFELVTTPGAIKKLMSKTPE